MPGRKGADPFTTPAERAQFDQNLKDAGRVLDVAVDLHRQEVAVNGQAYALARAYSACSLIDPAAAITMLTEAISRLAARTDP